MNGKLARARKQDKSTNLALRVWADGGGRKLLGSELRLKFA